MGFGLAPLGLAWLWGKVFSPPKPNAIKNAIYECGLVSKGDAWVQFRSAYYLYAIIFLIFDVEAVFLLPFAVAFTGLGVAACVAMLVFVLAADRRAGLGLGQRRADLGVKSSEQRSGIEREEVQK